MKKIIALLAITFIILQFFQIDKTNPPVNESVDFLKIKNTPQPIATHIRNACYDCHSNETQYPWYSNIQPVAWFLKEHFEEGRRALNFSTFATYTPEQQIDKMKEASELIREGKMPLNSYLIMHSEAKLTTQQKEELISYFNSIATNTQMNYPMVKPHHEEVDED